MQNILTVSLAAILVTNGFIVNTKTEEYFDAKSIIFRFGLPSFNFSLNIDLPGEYMS